MAKPWYAFFERDRAENDHHQYYREYYREYYGAVLSILGVITFGTFQSSLGWSVESEPKSPVGISSLSASTHDLAYDLERVLDPLEKKVPAKVGDKIKLKISGIPSGLSLNGSLDLSSAVDLQEQGWSLELNTAGSEYFISATPLKPGQLTIPSVVLKDASGKILARTNPFNLEVSSAIQADDPRPKEPEALEPPLSLQFPWWVMITLAILGVIVIGFAIYGIYRWRKAKKPFQVKQIEIYRSEDEIALESLTALDRQEFIKQGKFKAHYFKISEILKIYIGSRYRFDAPESTTREMITILKDQESSLEFVVIETLQTLFEKLDRVKFTDHVPDMDEAKQLIGITKEFILKTCRPATLSNPVVGGDRSAAR